VPVKFVVAGITWRSGAPIFTIRLALEAGPAEQLDVVAEDVSPVRGVPVVRDVPVVWPDVPAHSTE
jgi:hypothetical protein